MEESEHSASSHAGSSNIENLLLSSERNRETPRIQESTQFLNEKTLIEQSEKYGPRAIMLSNNSALQLTKLTQPYSQIQMQKQKKIPQSPPSIDGIPTRSSVESSLKGGVKNKNKVFQNFVDMLSSLDPEEMVEVISSALREVQKFQ